MDTIITTIAIGAMAVAAIVFFGMLFSVPVWLLWNGCLVPAVAGVHEIGLLQAWGLLILFGTLFKNSNVKAKG